MFSWVLSDLTFVEAVCFQQDSLSIPFFQVIKGLGSSKQRLTWSKQKIQTRVFHHYI